MTYDIKYKQKVVFREGFYKGAKGVIVTRVYAGCGDIATYDVDVLIDGLTIQRFSEHHLKKVTCKHVTEKIPITFPFFRKEYQLKCKKCNSIVRGENLW